MSNIDASTFQNMVFFSFVEGLPPPLIFCYIAERNICGKVKGYWFLLRHPQLSYITLSHSPTAKQPAVMSHSIQFQHYNIEEAPIYPVRHYCAWCPLALCSSSRFKRSYTLPTILFHPYGCYCPPSHAHQLVTVLGQERVWVWVQLHCSLLFCLALMSCTPGGREEEKRTLVTLKHSKLVTSGHC